MIEILRDLYFASKAICLIILCIFMAIIAFKIIYILLKNKRK